VAKQSAPVLGEASYAAETVWYADRLAPMPDSRTYAPRATQIEITFSGIDFPVHTRATDTDGTNA
jgi:hypothetical protein